MTLTYPLSLASFVDLLPAASVTFELGEARAVSRTRGGEQLSATLGTRLWQGQIEMGRSTRAEIQRVEAVIDLLRGAGTSFLMTDFRRPGPLADPTGSILGAAAVTIDALDSADARLVALDGLPAGYVLSAGDYLGFSYGSSPTRRALHRIATTTVTAAGDGTTSLFHVVPRLRPGAAVGAVVTLVAPVCSAVLVADSFDPGTSRRTISEGATFRWEQTLR